MVVNLTPSGVERILPNHLRPHIGENKRFRSLFYAKCLIKEPSTFGDYRDLFSALFKLIAQGRYTPFFNKTEIDQMYQTEVLDQHSLGSVLTPASIKTLRNWQDLIGNTSLGATYYQPQLRGSYLQDPENVLTWQTSLRRLKIIEDYIYHHPEVRAAIEELIK